MIPSAFKYHSPATLDEAITLLGDLGEDAKLLAGGHSLIPLMKLRLAAPAHVIDLGRVGGMVYIREDAGMIAIGAMTTHTAVAASALLRARAAAVAEAAASIGDVQVRNRGTIGGSIAHADPGADQPGVMLTMNAELVARGPNGDRTIAASGFFTELLTTALEPNEVLTEIRIPPLPARSGSTYLKMANPASGYAMVGISAAVTLGSDKSGDFAMHQPDLRHAGGTAPGTDHVSDVRIGISGVAETARRASAAEAALRERPATPENIAHAAQQASAGVEALGDIHASAGYRIHLVRVYTERALTAAFARARGA